MEGFEYILLYTINLNSPSQNVETQCPRPPRCIPAKRHPRSKHRKFTFRETIPFTSLIITLSAQGPRCCCSWFLFEEELGSWNSRRIPYWNLTPGLCGCSDVSRKSSGCKHTYSQWKSVSWVHRHYNIATSPGLSHSLVDGHLRGENAEAPRWVFEQPLREWALAWSLYKTKDEEIETNNFDKPSLRELQRLAMLGRDKALEEFTVSLLNTELA